MKEKERKSALGFLNNDEDGDKKPVVLPDLIGTGVLKDLTASLGQIVPEGSKILFIACDGKTEETVRQIAGRRYRVSAAIVPNKESRAAGLKSFAYEIKTEEDVKLVIAAGDGEVADVGKFVAARYRLPLCVVALSQADINYHTFVSSLNGADGTEKYRAVKPSLVVFDFSLYPESDELTAAGFGAACARLTTAFDLYAGRLLRGDDGIDAFGLVAKIVQKLISSDKITATVIGEATASLSAACGSDPRLSGGGAAMTAEVLETLKRRRGEISKLRGENEMLLALPLIRSYAAFFSLIPALPVNAPDGNLRLELLAKKLGANPFAAARRMMPQIDYDDLCRKIYVLGEYRSDLVARCVIIEKTLVFAAKRMKRLYKDKGYSYNNYLTADDMRICFALASEMRGGNAVMKVMKQAGYLEKIACDAAKIPA